MYKVFDLSEETGVSIGGNEPVVEIACLILIVNVDGVCGLTKNGNIVVLVKYFDGHEAVAAPLDHAAVLRKKHYVHRVGAILGILVVERLQVVDGGASISTELHRVVHRERVLRRAVAHLGCEYRYAAVLAPLVIIGGQDLDRELGVLVRLVGGLAVVDTLRVENEMWRMHVHLDDYEPHVHLGLTRDHIRRILTKIK